MTKRLTISTALATLALAACQQAPESGTSDTVQPDATESPMPVEPDGGTGAGATPPAAGGVAATTIPAAMQGRWGLVPADCTSTRGDAKGLIEVTGDAIKFYESRGTLGKIAERDDDSLRAAFAFTGEGMTWSRDMKLELEGDGKVLERTEFGEDAMQGTLRYTKCS